MLFKQKVTCIICLKENFKMKPQAFMKGAFYDIFLIYIPSIAKH